jgi:hypothetical protein
MLAVLPAPPETPVEPPLPAVAEVATLEPPLPAVAEVPALEPPWPESLVDATDPPPPLLLEDVLLVVLDDPAEPTVLPVLGPSWLLQPK